MEVRKDRLTGYLDDQKMKEVRIEGVVLSMYPKTKLRDDTLLGLTLPGGPVAFHRVEVVEVTGKGSFTRPEAAPIDLLRLTDPVTDKVKGMWARKGNDLVGLAGEGDGGHAVIELPYRPADEYDYLVEFTRLGSDKDVSPALSRADHSFKWVIDGQGNRCGFSQIDGRGVASHTGPQVVLVNGRRYAAKIEVRRGKATAYLDGQKTNELATDYSNLTMYPKTLLRDERLLGLTLHDGPVAFHRAEVVEVTGKGTLTRPEQAPIDLLRLIDPAKDTVKGVWERKGNDLVGDGGDQRHAVIEVPFRPAEEYDFLVDFTRLHGNSDVSLALSRAGRPFLWSMAVYGNRFGFELVDGVGITQDASFAIPRLSPVVGHRYSVKVEVRRDRVVGYFNGEKVRELKTDYSNLQTQSARKLRDDSLLGLTFTRGRWRSTASRWWR